MCSTEGNDVVSDTLRDVVENGGGRGNPGEEKMKSPSGSSRGRASYVNSSSSPYSEYGSWRSSVSVGACELDKELPSNSSRNRVPCVGLGVLPVVDKDETRSCSYAALARSDESKEKLFVWCLNVAGRRGGWEKMYPGVLWLTTREVTLGVRLDVGRLSGELDC